MNVKKAIKRIAALAAGTTMVTATIMGAMAYDLSDYPQPFVNEEGVFQGKLVIGQTAQVSDVIGAIDIAASLQAASKSGVEVGGSTETISVEGGVQVEGSSDDFNFGDNLSIDGGEFDDGDFEELLADGIVEDDDGTEYDYEQTIQLGDAVLMIGQDDDYGTSPVFYLDLNAADPEIVYQVEMKDQLDVTALTDSETIEMFGKRFTFDPNHAVGDDLTMYGSESTVVVTQNEPITVEVEGDDYTIEILGGNSDDSTAIIRVSGDGTETKTLEAGDSRSMAGLDIFIDDVFISNIGDASISVSVFVGSDKIVIPAAGVAAAESYTEIEINDDDETDIYGWVEGADLTAVDNIYFKVDPTDFMDEEIDDEYNWLPMGDEFVEPLFGFSLAFTGMSPEVEGREVVEFNRAGDAYSVAFTSNDGDEYDIEMYQGTGTAVNLGDDIVLGETEINDGDYFILEQTEADAGDSVTYIFEVRDVDDSTGDEKITLKNLGTGSSTDYDEADEIEDTGVYVDVTGPDTFELKTTSALTTNATSATRLVVEGGLIVNLDTALGDGANITVVEDSDDEDDTTATSLSFAIVADPDEDIAITAAASWTAGGDTATDSDGDILYGISDYGTWFEQERDNDGDYLNVYYSEQETDFNVFLNGPEAVVIKSGSSDGSAYTVNNFVVGQIAVYDSEAPAMLGATPLIVVGGPCVNTIAMDLMGNPETCWEGFSEGSAKIVLFEEQNAILVAGYSGEDTTGAAQVLAEEAYGANELSGSEVEVITTDLSDLEVNVVE